MKLILCLQTQLTAFCIVLLERLMINQRVKNPYLFRSLEHFPSIMIGKSKFVLKKTFFLKLATKQHIKNKTIIYLSLVMKL
jgi:hypothetical protein